MPNSQSKPVASPRRASLSGSREVSHHNIAEIERWLSLLGGGALTLYGLTRGRLGGLAIALFGGGLLYRGTTGYCPLYRALGVSTAKQVGALATIPASSGVKVTRGIIVLRPVEELYRFWRDFENLPRIMRHLESVQVSSPTRSRWVGRGPLGLRFEWDAEIINEKENELISWRSLKGSEVDTSGSVHFLPGPGDQTTQLNVVLKYNPPAGKVGAAIASMLGESPERQIEQDLRTFKWVMEFGRLSKLPEV
jgi:uncharacterized membrane protein